MDLPTPPSPEPPWRACGLSPPPGTTGWGARAWGSPGNASHERGNRDTPACHEAQGCLLGSRHTRLRRAQRSAPKAKTAFAQSAGRAPRAARGTHASPGSKYLQKVLPSSRFPLADDADSSPATGSPGAEGSSKRQRRLASRREENARVAVTGELPACSETAVLAVLLGGVRRSSFEQTLPFLAAGRPWKTWLTAPHRPGASRERKSGLLRTPQALRHAPSAEATSQKCMPAPKPCTRHQPPWRRLGVAGNQHVSVSSR